jgi:hypothetical protein
MKTITNEIIDKFIEAGLINIKSIDHVRKLEVMRDEFNLMEKEQHVQIWNDSLEEVLKKLESLNQYYNNNLRRR